MSEVRLSGSEAKAVFAVCLANLRGEIIAPLEYSPHLGPALVKLRGSRLSLPREVVTPQQAEVLAVLEAGELSTGEVGLHLGLSGRAACERLRTLRRKGLVVRPRTGYWRLAERREAA